MTGLSARWLGLGLSAPWRKLREASARQGGRSAAPAWANDGTACSAPVWIALSTTPDWRWLSVREDNP